MDPAIVAERLKEFLTSGTPDIVVQIPSGSGICSIANVTPTGWQPGFTSNYPGRWNKSGQPTKYFGQNFELCAAELFGTDTSKLDNVVCERWETTDTIEAFDISKFPSELKDAFFEDKGKAPEKWTKTHLFLDVAKELDIYPSVRSIYAPSASGQALNIEGYVFTADPKSQPIKFIETGKYTQMIQEPEV